MKKVAYVADLEQDIDDLIAIDYLQKHGCLKYVVLDHKSQSQLVEERIETLQKNGVVFEHEILSGEKYIFVGGSLTKVRDYLKESEVGIDLLIMNGGFVGCNIVSNERALKKFNDQSFMRTYNFNLDVTSTEYVLGSEKIKQIVLIGKNVCHSEKNTKAGIWQHLDFLNNYPIKNTKRLHDLLMVDEGLNFLCGNEEAKKLDYETIRVIKIHNDEEKKTSWGSELAEESRIQAAVDWRI